ncbi:family 2A encapsulin nanocompartment cargo protein cysteine desulfurase [Chitiniphilus shinanonensis]|uniref:family 2A encapsulin nanocompartment cargo protein cysteine desulfurase n=1 Tax=Chitiniphilus shinanonensis TaxID=553088 RepID=UPI000475B06F|nr:family 2A encapsulin nanocompartment cargo protein cysteine desulfurase [Chitiniphilus shinanonensis]
MTIQTPTSNPLPAGAAAGLPGEGELSRLASELFALLPGQSAPAPQRVAPTLEPASAGIPAQAGRAGQQTLAVPQAPAAHQPAVGGGALPGAPSTPYYFLGETGSDPLDGLAAQALGGDALRGGPAGLPGNDALAALVLDIDFGRPSTTHAQFAPAGSYYFLTPDGLQRGGDATAHPQATRPPFDVNAVRRDFPILAERVNGKPLIWLDNAATTHKPRAVIERLAAFYEHENSNIHRAAHELAARATDAYEDARQTVTRFIGARSPEEIVFVRGATEAINLVAQTFGKQQIGAGDEIIVSHLEHHANIVPWQQLAAEKGATLRVIPVDDDGQLRLDEYQKLLNSRTRLVAVTHVSNALGTVTPIAEIIRLGHAAGARVLIDGAQSVSHLRVNVAALDADFFVFSGHKVFAPTGIGVVYGKAELLETLPPWQGGGNMIADVTFEKTVFQPAPMRFEAGTGNIADAVGLGAALKYVERLGLDHIAAYEHGLLEYATAGLKTVPGLRLIGTAREKTSVLSFVLPGYRTEEVGHALNEEGIAVRSGHHCAQPILRRFGLEATVRPSLAFYNTCAEIDTLIGVVSRLAHARR